MSMDENSDGRFPKLITTNGKSLSPCRMRDGRLDDWSPFDEPSVPDHPLPERLYEERVESVAAQLSRKEGSDENIGWFASLGGRLNQLREESRRKRERARTLAVLRDLDDRLLQDIGVLRSELGGQ